MHRRNDVFFNEVLPEFLQRTRELFLKFSLFVQMDKIKVSDGMINFGNETMEKDRPERSLTLQKSIDNFTFSSTATQCNHATVEQCNVMYSHKDKIEHPIVEAISNILNIPQENVAVFSVGKAAWLVQIDQPEESVTSESDLTATIVEVLQLVLDLSKPIKSIEQIQYPVICFAGLKFFVKSSDGVCNLNIYGSFGSRCGNWTNICVEDEEPVKKTNLLEEVSFNDSPTIKCLARIGIDCESIDRHETFTSMGLDSLQCAELEMALQSEFPSYSIPTGIAMTKNTVEEMDTYLMSCVVACEINNKDDDAYSGHVPLSPQQRGLVFMSELEPLTRAQFNEPVVFAMDAAIFDERRFLRVLNSIVMRHSILRTRYYANGQTILSGTEVFFTCTKSSMDPQIFVKAPMDIKDSSMQVMVSHSAGRVVVCLVFHHIAVDGHSINITTREIGALYSGEELTLPRKQYVDYARQTVGFNHNERLVKWRERLNGIEFQLLPTDKSRTSKRTYNGGFTQKKIPAALQSSLRKLRQAANCTNFCIFTAVCKFLIYKTSGILDFPIGFPSTLRTKEYADTVGCFVNVVPLVEALNPSFTIVQYLRRLSAAIDEARSTDVPLDVLVSDLSIERDDNVSPLFQVLLVLDNVQPPPPENGIVLLDCPTQFAKYEQTWYFRTDGKSINICVEYNRDLFRQQTMEDLVDRFLFILKTFGKLSPDCRLRDIAIVRQTELRSIMGKRNANRCDISKATVLEMFRKNLSTSGVIKFRGKRMSYEELDEESSRVSDEITSVYSCHYGELPTRDRCAVVFMERSFDLLVIILAIWKSGMVAVPISLDWPTQRVIDMLELLSNPILVGTISGQLRNSANNIGVPVLARMLQRKKRGRFLNRVELNDLAYITCTSGTTGIPKMVCTEFSGHSNLAAAYTKAFVLHNSSHTYQVVNYAFDIFFADLIKTLVNGASTTLADGLIPNLLEMDGVTNAYIMPAYLSSLSSSDIERLAFVESIHFGGEAIQPLALRLLLQIGACIYHEHGVTEQTVFTTCNRMRVYSPIPEIGAPYRNLHHFLRDDDGQLLPEKYQGIYHVGGCGLFRGYYGNQKLTAIALRQGILGKEMRTGDVVRCEHDRFHFQGRNELQVKIRGRLIDLLEIQHEICSHDEVDACTIAVHEENGTRELAAYVITSSDCWSAEALVLSLSERLPSYCIPKHFVPLKRFPLNQNGKIDKKLLPKPLRQCSVSNPRSPEGDLEKAVVDSFKKYTKRDFMIDECFFDFGGDSVKAMLVVQDLAAQGYEMELRALFSLRTAEKIASYLESKKNAMEISGDKIPTTTSSAFEIPLSPQQKRLWFLAKMYPDRDSYIIRLQLNFNGQLDELKLRQSFNAVVINNPATRSKLESVGMEPMLIRLSGTECFHDLTPHIRDPQLQESSLITAKITKTHQSVQLELRVHHINSDGRSLAIIGEQLAMAYNGGHIRAGNCTVREETTGDYLEFWKVYLQDYEPLAIQAKGDAGAHDGEAGYVKAVLDFVKEAELRRACSIHGCTLYQILVVCYIQALRTVYDLTDIVIGTTVANRTPENMNVVGLFTNTIPLRFREEFADFPMLLRYANDQILSAMEHQSTPLAKIVEEIIVDRDVTSTPLFRHVLTLESASILELPKMIGTESEVIEPRTAFTQFDQSWIFHHGKELSLLIQYDKSHCSISTINELLKLFKRFLNRILKQKQPIGLLGTIDSPLSYNTPRCKTLGTAFNEQATIIPSNVCLEASSSILSFQNAIEAAGNFANQMEETILKNNGEPPRSDDAICIVLPETIKNHITIISVHLLGCAYLCLPPDTPTERLQYILADCQAQLVVTDLNLPNISVPILYPQLSFEKRTNRWPRSCLISLAYLIYTSGTTGKPKGVCVSHQSTLNMLKHATKLYGFRPGGRVLQFTKSSFDASISNTFGSLLNGGNLSIRDKNVDAVEDLVKRQPIAVVHMTPIIMEMFSEQDLSRLSEVELWSFGGETISESTLYFMIRQGQQLVQLYGPTEATCYQTSLKMKRGDSATCLGLAIPGLPHGLCSFSNPSVERKDVGQFYCSGENLARGYISASSQGFIDNPFRTLEDRLLRRNHKVYLVGDKLRRDQNGHLHFLGRNDDQVKVKGQRVQLSEIEAVARNIKGVTNAVAVIQRDTIGSNNIVFFYTGTARDPLAVLQNKIPSSMLPSKLIHLPKFPLTSNKKVDKVKLSSRADFLAPSKAEADPRDHVEQQVLKSYREVLQQQELDINSNFFQAGGHSLLAVRLVARLEKSLGLSVPIVKIFEYPHVKDLANWIKGIRKTSTEVDAEEKTKEEKCIQIDEEPSPMQITLLRSFRNPKARALYDLSFSVILKKAISACKCVEIVNQLIMIHSSLRTRFARNGRSYTREVLSGTECFQNLDAKADLILDPFEKPPFLVCLDADRICVAANHIIIDGHSMQIIVADLAQLLNQQKVPMDEGSMFHSWLLQQFRQCEKDDLQYWKEKLKGYVHNQLPTTFPRLVINEPTAVTLVFPEGQLRSRVQASVERYGCSPFVVVLTFLSKALQQFSCDPTLPIAIGFPVNLRTQNFQNYVGFGVNTVLVLQDTRGTQEKVLQSMMTEVANAMSHAFLPFEELVNLSPSKKLINVMLIHDSYSIYENEILFVKPTAASVTKFEISVFIDPQTDTIQFEFNKNLFDEEFIRSLAETFQNIVCNWDYTIPRKVSNPIRIDEVVYNPSDVTKLVASLPIEDLRLTHCSNALELHYSSKTQINEDIRKALEMLPRALHPQKLVFCKKITEDFPLSTQQLQMYYLSLEDPQAYVLPFLKKFPETISPVHLHRALLYEIQRNESLRTIFFEKEGQPRQMVLSMTEAYVTLNIQNTNHMKESVEMFIRFPIELTDGVPIRSTLFREHGCTLAVMVLNHIISDAWSTTILEQELSAIMEKLYRGDRPSIYRQNHSYRDYCLKKGKEVKLEESYINELVNAEEIPLDEGEGEVELLRFEFSETIAQRWTKRCGASLFVVVLMMLSNSIMNNFGLRSVNIGAPHSNRTTETKSIVGYFLNNLVFHIRKQDDDSTALQTLQRHVADVLLKNAPFPQLVNSARQLKRHLKPLFHVYFNCRYDLEVDEADDEEIISMLPVTSAFPLEIDLEKCSSGYRMTLRMQKCFPGELGKRIMEDIRLQLQFDALPPPPQSDACSGPTCLEVTLQLARKVLGVETIDGNENFFSAGGNSLQVIGFVEMLEEALNVEVEISEIYQMKSFSELAKQLQSMLGAARHDDSHDGVLAQAQECFTRLFRTTTDSRKRSTSRRRNFSDTPTVGLSDFLLKLKRYGPKTSIIEHGVSEVTYTELTCSIERQAASITRSYCQITGEILRNDTIIPVIGNGSGSTITTCLSIMTSGAVYLPIDASLPLERIEVLLKESNAECYIGAEFPDIHLQSLSTTMPAGRCYGLLSTSTARDLAYVTYTSGTTGIPKGVCINQGAVMNMMQSSTVDFHLNPDDVIYQFTNFIYDNSVLEIFMTLANGAKLIVDKVIFSPRRFISLMEQYGITYCLLFPGLVATFSERHFRRLADLRYWIVGAEKFPQQMFDMAIEAGVSVIQNYGPTEATAYALTKHMKITDLANNLGKTIRSTEMLVGENGELLMRGMGLMRGYLGHRRNNVLVEGSWYPTGDQVRLLPNGDVLFLGRRDNQVKIRGQRVELSEIEVVIGSVRGVKQCTVIFKEADQMLLAFITSNSRENNVVSEVLHSCSKQLPSHMRPTHVLLLDEFPLTKNAKVDVALLSKEWKKYLQKGFLELVEGLLERKLDPKMNFLEVGGSTKQAIKLRLLLTSKYGQTFSITQLLKRPLEDVGKEESLKMVNKIAKEPQMIDERLKKVWTKVLKHDNFGTGDHFFFIGGNSIALIKLRYEINAEFGKHFSVQDLLNGLVFNEMRSMIDSTNMSLRIATVVHNPPRPRFNLVFIHALYGGSVPYADLIMSLKQLDNFQVITVQHPNTFGFESDDLRFFNSVQSVAEAYAAEVNKLLNRNSDTVLIGASFGGTIAVEMANHLDVSCRVIVIDSGTDYRRLQAYSFIDHKKSMEEALTKYAIDDDTKFWMVLNSWDMLTMLSDFEPTQPNSIGKLNVFSIDGTDLGWSRWMTTSITKITGTHPDMLSAQNSHDLATKIVQVLFQSS